jgi:hypothetical protein
MAKHPDDQEESKAVTKTATTGGEPPASERTKAEQQAGVEAAKDQAASQKRAQYESEHADDPERNTYIEPTPLNSEADVTEVGRRAEEMNKEHEEEDRRGAARGTPGGLNPGGVASRGFSPEGRPATGTYPQDSLANPDATQTAEQRAEQREQRAAKDKKGYPKLNEKE